MLTYYLASEWPCHHHPSVPLNTWISSSQLHSCLRALGTGHISVKMEEARHVHPIPQRKTQATGQERQRAQDKGKEIEEPREGFSRPLKTRPRVSLRPEGCILTVSTEE